MVTRQSSAQWNGNLREGNGTLKLGSGAFEGPYSFPSRFESGNGTNPEELVAAAHAACYAMALSAGLAKDGIQPKQVNAQAKVTLGAVEGGFAITEIVLDVEADVPGIDEAKFMEYAEATKTGCPISKALSAVPMTLNAKLLAAV